MSEGVDRFDLEAYLSGEAEAVNRALLRALDRMGRRLEESRRAPSGEIAAEGGGARARVDAGDGGGADPAGCGTKADPAALLDVVRHGVMTDGKRLRPILCIAAYRAVRSPGAAGAARGSDPAGGNDDALYDLAAALEMIHAYSLMHDDLPSMDDADLRRGKPTPHIVFGEAPTTVAAAALIPAAALHAWEAAGVLGCDDDVRREVVRELARAAGAGGMVGGQALDLLGEGRRVTAQELDGLHERKTGALLAASLRIGAIAAGAPAPARTAVERYGRAIGLAFQIVDDILDATASAAALGKNPSDREMEKSTYVALHGLDEAKAHADVRVREARAALVEAGIDAPALFALSAFIVERGH